MRPIKENITGRKQATLKAVTLKYTCPKRPERPTYANVGRMSFSSRNEYDVIVLIEKCKACGKEHEFSLYEV